MLQGCTTFGALVHVLCHAMNHLYANGVPVPAMAAGLTEAARVCESALTDVAVPISTAVPVSVVGGGAAAAASSSSTATLNAHYVQHVASRLQVCACVWGVCARARQHA